MTMSLNNRLSIILALMLSTAGVASHVILNSTIAPAFNTLETDAAAIDLGRAELAIDGQLRQLKAIAGDWAPWNEPNAFAKGENPDFLWRNIDLSTFRNVEIELMQFFDIDGKLLWSGFLDQGLFSDIGSLGRLGSDDELYGTLTRHGSTESVISGLLMTARGPMLLVSMPLVEETGKGPVSGTIILGRMLTAARLQDLREHIKVPFDIVPMQEAAATISSLTQRLDSATDDDVVQTIDDSEVRSYRLLAGISGDPVGILVSRTAREVTALGHNAAGLALWMFVVMGLVLVALTWIVIRKNIVGRLERLAKHIAGIRRNGDLSARITPDRDDEIGRLGHSFNALTGELQEARRELVEQSFRAGRADTAADVLHNVRNAMTPVINVTENLSGRLQEISTLRLAQAADELAEPNCPEERRNALLQYITAAAAKLRRAGDDAANDVDRIYRQARLVGEILSGQEKVARFPSVQERVNLARLLSEAAATLPANRDIDVDLQIAPELTGVFVAANRVQLLQIISNVMLNAFESVERSGGHCARIEVSAADAPGGNSKLLQLFIRDNGAGLDPAHVTQIFQRGVSSKTVPGHGIGLHWCANAVSAIGGSIGIKSEGPGKGAAVHIRLPAAPPVNMAGDAG